MTIKIENIPEGQKIKSINFNIDFESGESEKYVKLPVEKTTNTTEPNIAPLNIASIDTEKRAPKEVPNEMLDMEF
jgi:hypothetical protein